MYETLLFKESPFLGGAFLLAPIILYYNDYTKISAVFVVLFIFLLFFYRYKPHNVSYPDNVLISPNEGVITSIIVKDNLIYVSVYMDVFNNHTQIYPINGMVIDRIYDNSGIFNLVVEKSKCRNNEKKIYYILFSFSFSFFVLIFCHNFVSKL